MQHHTPAERRHATEAESARLAQIAQQEGWLQPLPEVHRATHLKPWQHALFWGLRLYIVVLTVIVAWAFTSGRVAG
ncbi:hypothetical protein [Thiomonas sp.]|jgi:hypothetical protein|uniref:hypothetical protein n=1 Tax=Thiomonas sp. TaxID=2047785 RepID=UPI002612E12D|nr:hypothetical protein [Thiomonas sp.]